MILLDTHVWVWWVAERQELSADLRATIEAHQGDGLGVSIISCWEVAKLVERGRLALSMPVENWIAAALKYPGVVLLELTPKIVVESTQLPGQFHQDPADQMIVATARVFNIPLLTVGTKIRRYPYVQIAGRTD